MNRLPIIPLLWACLVPATGYADMPRNMKWVETPIRTMDDDHVYVDVNHIEWSKNAVSLWVMISSEDSRSVQHMSYNCIKDVMVLVELFAFDEKGKVVFHEYLPDGYKQQPFLPDSVAFGLKTLGCVIRDHATGGELKVPM